MIDPTHYPLVIAVFSVVLIPTIVRVGTYVWQLWDDSRNARLDKAIGDRLKCYTTTEEIDMQIERLEQQQETRHLQNRDLLESIQKDGLRREGLILGQLKQGQDENRARSEKTDKDVGELRARVDRVLELSGDRRRS